MGKLYELNGVSGLVEQRRVRQNGALTSIYHAEQGGYDSESGQWALVCEDHHWIAACSTLALARHHMPDPIGWCEPCQSVHAQRIVGSSDSNHGGIA